MVKAAASKVPKDFITVAVDEFLSTGFEAFGTAFAFFLFLQCPASRTWQSTETWRVQNSALMLPGVTCIANVLGCQVVAERTESLESKHCSHAPLQAQRLSLKSSASKGKWRRGASPKEACWDWKSTELQIWEVLVLFHLQSLVAGQFQAMRERWKDRRYGRTTVTVRQHLKTEV